MANSETRRKARCRRAGRVRKKIHGTDARPRLTVFRSNRQIYVQVISDESGRTLAASSTLKEVSGGVTLAGATALGKDIAERMKQLSIGEAIFDRGGYKYHGRVRAIAEAVRESGLKL